MFPVNLFVSFLRCFVMLNSHDVCFIIYIYIYIIIYYILLYIILNIYFIIKKNCSHYFRSKNRVCFSFYPVSLIFEYEAKPHIRWPHIREYEAGVSGANFTSVWMCLYVFGVVWCVSLSFHPDSVSSESNRSLHVPFYQWLLFCYQLNCYIMYPILKLQRCNRWSLALDEQFHLALYWACDYLYMLGLKLIHVSQQGPW